MALAAVLAAAGAAIGFWMTMTGTHRSPVVTQYEAVSCTSASSCIAVGDLAPGRSEPALLLVGSAGPSVLATLGSPGAISCVRYGPCLWVGALEHRRRLVAGALLIQGSTVTNVSSNPLIEVGGPQDLSCLPLSCVELGAQRTSLVPGAAWVSQWSGSTWRWRLPRRVPAPRFTEQLDSVSCASSMCMAVGHGPGSRSASISVMERRGRWRRVPLPSLHGGLWSVSCASDRYCMAVGTNLWGRRSQPSAVIWNGSVWRVIPTAGLTPRGGFLAVSCPEISVCIAAGMGTTSRHSDATFSPSVWRWDGRTWTNLGESLVLPDARRRPGGLAYSFLSAISCVDPIHCVAGGTSYPPATGVLAFSGVDGWHLFH